MILRTVILIFFLLLGANTHAQTFTVEPEWVEADESFRFIITDGEPNTFVEIQPEESTGISDFIVTLDGTGAAESRPESFPGEGCTVGNTYRFLAAYTNDRANPFDTVELTCVAPEEVIVSPAENLNAVANNDSFQLSWSGGDFPADRYEVWFCLVQDGNSCEPVKHEEVQDATTFEFQYVQDTITVVQPGETFQFQIFALNAEGARVNPPTEATVTRTGVMVPTAPMIKFARCDADEEFLRVQWEVSENMGDGVYEITAESTENTLTMSVGHPDTLANFTKTSNPEAVFNVGTNYEIELVARNTTGVSATTTFQTSCISENDEPQDFHFDPSEITLESGQPQTITINRTGNAEDGGDVFFTASRDNFYTVSGLESCFALNPLCDYYIDFSSGQRERSFTIGLNENVNESASATLNFNINDDADPDNNTLNISYVHNNDDANGEDDGNAEFTPLVGVPGIEEEEQRSIAAYLNAIYLLVIVLAALFAVIRIAIAGVKYMTSDVVTSKESAKDDIKGALLGLAILLSTFIVLSTIYGGLTNLNILGNLDAVTPGEPPPPCEPAPENYFCNDHDTYAFYFHTCRIDATSVCESFRDVCDEFGGIIITDPDGVREIKYTCAIERSLIAQKRNACTDTDKNWVYPSPSEADRFGIPYCGEGGTPVTCGDLPDGVSRAGEIDWEHPGDQRTFELGSQTKYFEITTTGNPAYDGQIATTFTSTNPTTRTVWISECPGAPISSAARLCSASGSLDATVYWAQNPNKRAACALQPNKPYFINVKNVVHDNPNVSTCPSGECPFHMIVYTNGKP